ncbi:MAG: methyl-accepting chemotaxis protein [Acidobacteriaceae bacterium]
MQRQIAFAWRLLRCQASRLSALHTKRRGTAPRRHKGHMKNLTIGFKLMLSIGVLAFGYLLFFVLVVWTGSNMQRHLHLASDSLFPAALAGQEADASFQKLTGDYKDAILTQNAAMLSAADLDAQEVATDLQMVREKTAQNAALQQQIALMQDQFAQVSSQSKSTYTKMIVTPNAMDDQDMATVKSLAVESANMSKSLNDLNELIGKKDFPGELNAVKTSTNLQRLLTLFLFVVALAFAVLTTLMLERQIALPLRRAVDVLRQVAQGDLTATLEVGSHDEVGKMAGALNEALERLRTTLQEVTASAADANSSSQQLAAATEIIASGAQEQAASLEETSASLEEITATVRQSADNARQASQLASGSKHDAENGQEVVAHAVTAMAEINVASAKISDIISTIDEIAFQTNLLAVNAAVEAARAGEEGRGFAVVAAEVRSLALRSAGAAKEIKSLIQDTLRKVERGTNLVNKSGETLQGIVSSVKRVTDIVGEIAVAASEQSTGIEQVNTAMTQMDGVTQSNSTQTEELSATAASLAGQSATLMELVGTFTLSKGGEDALSVAASRGGSPVATRRPSPTKKREDSGSRFAAADRTAQRGLASAQRSAIHRPTLSTVGVGGENEDSFQEF